VNALRPAVLAAVVLTVVAVVAGCGDEPVARQPASTAAAASTAALATAPDAYEAQVRQAIRGMQQFARELEALDAVRLRTAAPRLASAHATFHDAVQEIATLVPPPAYRPAHESVVGALRGLDASMGELVAAAKSGDEQAFLAADARFRASAARVARAADKIGRADG
jgi:hypothetical protein